MNPLLIYGLLLSAAILAIIFYRSDFVREFLDPHTYWTEKAARSEEMVRFYRNDVQQCADKLQRLLLPSSREIWIKQKRMEGMSAAEAEADYVSAVKASKAACEIMRSVLLLEMQELESARSRNSTSRN